MEAFGWWDPVDVTTWSPFLAETRGKRPKRWLRDPSGRVWLQKSPPTVDASNPHTARRSEPAIEVFALHLADRVGIPIATIRPATWTTGDNFERGIVSLRFHDDDEQHHPGAELLGLPTETGSDAESRRRTKEGKASATFERVRTKLVELEQVHGIGLQTAFARILVVDAWLGNGDRHSGNWALITGPRGARLAPMYDPTACLGVELTEEREILDAPTADAIAAYAANCPSGFGGGIVNGRPRPGIPMTELIGQLAGWSPWAEALSELRPRLIQATAEAEALLDAIPDDWLPARRKRFAARVLAHRVTLLS